MPRRHMTVFVNLKNYLWDSAESLFYALLRHDSTQFPTLSQIPAPVATTPTRIWLFFGNQPKITVSLHQ